MSKSMNKYLYDFAQNMLTSNKAEIPLYYVTFDYNKFKETGNVGSCQARIHPLLNGDDQLKGMINKTIDYIRDNYDMGEM